MLRRIVNFVETCFLSLVPKRTRDKRLLSCPICGKTPYIYNDDGIFGSWFAVYCPTSWILFKLLGAKNHSHFYVHCGKADAKRAYDAAVDEWNKEVNKAAREAKIQILRTKKSFIEERFLL